MTAPIADINDIAVVYNQTVDDTAYTGINVKVADNSFIFFRRGDDPLTDVKIIYNDAEAGEGWQKVPADLNPKGTKRVYICHKKGGKGQSPIIGLRVMFNDEYFAPAGYIKLPQSLNPGLAINRTPRQYLAYKTRAAQQKQEERNWIVGDKVDALDTSQNWLVAKILKIKDDGQEIHINYVGWPHKWDEWLQKQGPRVLPVGAKTGGRWTGRDPRPPFSLDENLEKFNEILNKVKEVEATVKAGKDVKEEDISFLIKGDNREYLENVLGAEVEDVDALVPLVQDYLQTNLRLIVQALNNPKLFPNKIFLGLLPIFGAANFEQRYYLLGVNKEKGQKMKFVKKPSGENPVSLYLLENINHFGEEGGFDAIQKRLAFVDTKTETKGEESFDTVSILIKALAIVQEKGLFTGSFTKKYWKDMNLKNLVQRTLARITDDELKGLDKDSFGNLVNDVKILMKNTAKDKEVDEFAERMQLEISLRLLSADVLRKRIDALSQLHQTIRQVNYAANPSLVKDEVPDERRPLMDRMPHGQHEQQLVKAKYLTPQSLSGWMIEHKLVNKILGKGSHEQLVKMSPIILKFLAQNKVLTVEHIDLLWNSSVGGDEALRRIVYDALADLAQELSEKQVDALYERIKSLPLKDYRDFYLTFLKDFTLSAVKAVGGKNFYGLDIFWQIVQDENAKQVPKDVRYLSFGCLKELLSSKYFEAHRAIYLEKCLQNLRDGKSVWQSLQVARPILEYSETDASKQIEKVDKKFKLLDVLLEDAKAYMDTARKEASKLGSDELKEGKELILVGTYTHHQQVTQRLTFLNFILSSSKLVLEKGHVDKLWDVFVSHPVFPTDTNALLHWLKNAIDASHRQAGEGKKRAGDVLNPEIINYIFRELLCRHLISTKTGYECFQIYFLEINFKNKTISAFSPVWLVVLEFSKLVGLEALWDYATKSPDPQVATMARQFLTTLNIRLDTSIPSKEKKLIYQGYIINAMKLLAQGHQQVVKEGKEVKPQTLKSLTDSVELLDLFLQRIESGEANKRPLFTVGEKVKAHWKTQKPKKYGAIVVAVNADMSYDVQYDDGDRDRQCPESNLFTLDEKKKMAAKSDSDDEDEKFPKVFLSSDKKYFDLFFSLLDVGGELADKLWSLLKRLPINQDMENKVKALAKADSVDWKTVFPTDSIIKLLYTLGIVRDTILKERTGRRSSKDGAQSGFPEDVKAWNQMFLERGGFNYIYEFFMSSPLESMLRDVLPQQCLTLVITVLRHYLTGTTETLGVDNKSAHAAVNPSKLVHSLLEIIKASVDLKAADEETARNQGELVERSFTLLVHLVVLHSPLLDQVIKYDWKPILLKGLTANPNPFFRRELSEGLKRLAAIDAPKTPPRSLFLPILLGQLEHIDTASTECPVSDYFATLEGFLAIPLSEADGVDPKTLSKHILKLLNKHPILESSDKEHDPVLLAILSLALRLVSTAPSLRTALGVDSGKDNLVQALYDMLFQVPEMNNSISSTGSGNENPPPKCKSSHTRNIAIRLLAEMCQDVPQNTFLVAELLTPNHQGAKKRGWEFAPQERQTRSRGSPYVGLKNLGCICYMNAAMQQLFMIPKLRQNILAVDQYSESAMSNDLVYQLQYVMAHLQESEKQAINPKPFTDIWMDETGKKAINVGKQDDSSAFVIRLIDRISELVKKSEQHKDCFREVMGGLFEHQLIGKGECLHCKVSRDEEFFTIPLEVKTKKNIEESLKAFTEGSEVEGYNCEECKKKVTVVKRAVVKKLPPTLCITLKRFVLNYETFQTEKLDDRIDFPIDLDMRPYSTEALPLPQARSADEGKGDDEGKGGDQPTATEKPVSKSKSEHPENYYKYVLRGVVIHTGTAHSGHYYSFIQERLTRSDGKQEAGKWFKFNDTMVSDFDPREIPDQCFGGNNPRAQSGFGGIANGYLLFYDRAEPKEPEAKEGEAPKPIKNVKATRARSPVPPKIFQDLYQQNLTYWRDKAIFDDNYYLFLHRLQADLKQLDKYPDVKDISEVDLAKPCSVRDAVTRLITRFIFMTWGRAKHRENTTSVWVDALKRLYNGNKASSVWLLNMLGNPATGWVPDYLLECPDDLLREGTADVIAIASALVAPFEEKTFDEAPVVKETKDVKEKEAKEEPKQEDPRVSSVYGPLPPRMDADGRGFSDYESKEQTVYVDIKEDKQDTRGYLVGFIDLLVRYVRVTPTWWRNFRSFYKVFAEIANIGKKECAYLEKHEMIARLIDIYLRDASPHPEVNNVQTDKAQRRYHQMRGSGQASWPQLNSPDFSTFFQLLRTLVTYQPFKDHTPLAKEMLTLQSFLSHFLMEAFSAQRAKDVVPVVTHICHESFEYSESFAELFKVGFRHHNYEQVRPYFRSMLALIDMKDSIQEQRIGALLDRYLSVMKDQDMWWKMTDMLLNILFDLLNAIH